MFLQDILMMSFCPYNQWQSACLFKNYNGDCLITCLEWFYTETLIIMIVLVISDDDCKSCFAFVFCKSKKGIQYNDQMKKDKQWSAKHYTENSDWATQTH